VFTRARKYFLTHEFSQNAHRDRFVQPIDSHMTTSARRITQRAVSIAATLAIVLTGGIARPFADTPKPCAVRFDDRGLSRLAQQGLARSATLRALFAELDRARVIVYTSISRDLGAGVGGRVRFIGVGGDGWRFLRLEVDDRRTRVELLAILGHELQHASEIARATEVVDEASMAAFYDRIGFASVTAAERALPTRARNFETQAAIDVERRVFSELFGDRW